VGGTGNDVVVTVVPGAPTCDLSVAKSAPASVALATGALDYTITVANAGSGSALGAVMVDSLPAGLRYASAVPSQGTCAATGGRVTCSLGDIAAAGSASIAIHATFDFDTLVVVNTATASATNKDTNGGNNTASATTLVLPATTGERARGCARGATGVDPAQSVAGRNVPVLPRRAG